MPKQIPAQKSIVHDTRNFDTNAPTNAPDGIIHLLVIIFIILRILVRFSSLDFFEDLISLDL